MTLQTRRLFQRVGNAPKEKRGHSPTIHIAGGTVKVFCLCGHKLGGGTGCNRAGMDYCIAWAKTAYESHAKKVSNPVAQMDDRKENP